MAGRPRLVEEGTPLWGNGQDEGDTRDHAMQDADHHQEHGAGQRRGWNQTVYNHEHEHSQGTVSTSGSSLLRAIGMQTFQSAEHHPRHSYRAETRFVIGGGDGGKSVEHHENAATASIGMSPIHFNHERIPSREQFHPVYHAPAPRTKRSSIPTRLVVGGEAQPQHPITTHEYYDDGPVERMEGVVHDEIKGPLVVIDGANVAYAYADAIAGLESVPAGHGRRRREPDSRGIQVAATYFLSMDVRVIIVLPAPWFRSKPRTVDTNQSNSMMLTPQLEVLKDLKARGLLLASPPTDDDDAYALTVARREDARSQNRASGGGFVLSCDMFRDAVQRDVTGELKEWLLQGSGSGPGRISFAFCDLGSRDDYGDREMDFVPNPRHELVQKVEHEHRKLSFQT